MRNDLDEAPRILPYGRKLLLYISDCSTFVSFGAGEMSCLWFSPWWQLSIREESMRTAGQKFTVFYTETLVYLHVFSEMLLWNSRPSSGLNMLPIWGEYFRAPLCPIGVTLQSCLFFLSKPA